MQTRELLPHLVERVEDPAVVRRRALARLTELVRLDREVQRTPVADRAIALNVLRRAVFAAYRAAVEAGAGAEGIIILREAAGSAECINA